MSRKFTVAKTNKMVQEDALLLDMQTCEVINRVSSTIDLESLSVLSDLEKKFLWHPGYESSNFPQNLTNARVLFSTLIDHCLDHFESLEFAQAQLREKSLFTSLFSSQSAVFALCRYIRSKIVDSGCIKVSFDPCQTERKNR